MTMSFLNSFPSFPYVPPVYELMIPYHISPFVYILSPLIKVYNLYSSDINLIG